MSNFSNIPISHYKVLTLPLNPEPNSVYYILDKNSNIVKGYITSLKGEAIPLFNVNGGSGTGSVESVTGTGVTGTPTNPVVDIATFVSSQLGNLVHLSIVDGKLAVNKITSPDSSIAITNTPTEIQIQLSQDIQTIIDGKEDVANKQNNLNFDGTGGKYPTIDTVNEAFLRNTRLFARTGISNKNDGFELTIVDAFTIGINQVDSAIFWDELFEPNVVVGDAIKTFPQINYPLTELVTATGGNINTNPIVADGIYVRYLGYDINGNVVSSPDSFIENSSVVQLGFTTVLKTGATVTFLGGTAPNARNVFSQPILANLNDLDRITVTSTTDITVNYNTGTPSLNSDAGIITGIAINWRGVNNPTNSAPIDKFNYLGDNEVDFVSLTPNSLTQTTPFVMHTLWTELDEGVQINESFFNTTSQLRDTLDAGAFGIKRVLIGIRGGIFIQESEFATSAGYATIDAARANVFTHEFTDAIIPSGLVIEIARIIFKKSVTDFSDEDEFVIVSTAGGSSSGGSIASVGDATTVTKGIIKLAGDFDPTSTADFPVIISATETQAGKVELATAAETAAGLDNTRAVHPLGLQSTLASYVPISGYNLQSIYLNSTPPVITTTTALGAFTLKRGSALDSDNIFVGQNGAGTITSFLQGNGLMNLRGNDVYYQTFHPTDGGNTIFGHVTGANSSGFIAMYAAGSGHNSGNNNMFIGNVPAAATTTPQQTWISIKSTAYDAWADSRLLFRFQNGYQVGRVSLFEIGTDYIRYPIHTSARNDSASTPVNFLFTDGTGILRSRPVNDLGTALTNVMHLSGNETFTGTKSFTVAGTTAPALDISNPIAGTVTTSYGLRIQNSNTGSGLYNLNSSSGTGVYINNTGLGQGFRIDNGNAAIGCRIFNIGNGWGLELFNQSIGQGISLNNQSSGIGQIIANTSTGIALRVDNSTAATGKPFQYTKNGVERAFLNDAGQFQAVNFVTTGGTASQVVLGNGTLGAFSSISGTTNFIPKFTSANNLGNSRIKDDGTYLGIGSVSPIALSKDIQLGRQANKEIGIEQSDSSTVGRNLTISAGRTINFQETANFLALGQTARTWTALCGSKTTNNMYAIASGLIYKQTNGIGVFIDIGAPNRNYSGIASSATDDIYFCVNGGDVYKLTNETGTLTALGFPSRAYNGIVISPAGDLYVCVNNGDIYKQTGLSGSLNALGQTARAWTSMASSNTNDIFATVNGGFVYKQTASTGNFNDVGFPSGNYLGVTVTPSNNLYLANRGVGIFEQINCVGALINLNQGNSYWAGAGSSTNGNVYISNPFDTNDIFMQNNFAVGTIDLNGGTLLLKAGTGKAAGQSRVQVITGAKTVSGTNMQLEQVVVEFDENRDATFFGRIIKSGGTSTQFLMADGSTTSGVLAKTRKDITGTSYTLLSSDFDKILYTTNASPVTITVPSGLTINQEYEVLQYGDGLVSYVTSGTTLRFQDYELASHYAKYSRVSITYIDTETYQLLGQLSMI